MKSLIRIVPANATAIEAALEAVNGTATAHTFNAYSDVEKLATDAGIFLAGLGLTKKEMIGARRYRCSGDKMPNAYKYSRKATRIEIERRSSGWFLVSVRDEKIYNDGGYGRALLTPAQRDIAVRNFTGRFGVLA